MSEWIIMSDAEIAALSAADPYGPTELPGGPNDPAIVIVFRDLDATVEPPF